MTAWRMYYRTLDEESVAVWRAQGIATETAVLSTWIRREAEREGLEVHPTASAWIKTIREGGESMGVCVSIPVRADPDPRYVAGPEQVIRQPITTRRLEIDDEPRSGGVVVWLAAILVIAAFVLLVVYLASQPSAAPRPAASPHDPAAGGEMAGVARVSPSAWDASGAPLTGAPLDVRHTAGPNLAPTVSAGTDDVGGAPSALDPRVGREGVITHMGDDYPWPVDYLAIPLGPGRWVTICGPAACREMVSTDAGPNRKKLLEGVIADVSWQRFETLCGVKARMGRCPGSWTVVTGPRPTLPPTSTEDGS